MIYHVLSVLKFNLDLSLRPSTLLRSSWGLEAARERERDRTRILVYSDHSLETGGLLAEILTLCGA